MNRIIDLFYKTVYNQNVRELTDLCIFGELRLQIFIQTESGF